MPGWFLALATLAVAAVPSPPRSAPADGEGPRHPAAAAAAAAERGWFGAARRLWRESEAAGGGSDSRAAEQLDRLARVEKALGGTAARGTLTTATATPSAAPGTSAWRELWRGSIVPRSLDGSLAHAGGLILGGGLVLWNTGHAVHAVTLSGGRLPWPREAAVAGEELRGADGRDTAIFPRGLAAGGRAAGSDTAVCGGRPAVSGGRCHAVVGLNDGSQRLVCLDISPAAQGRIEWTVTAQSLTAAVAGVRRAEGSGIPARAAAAMVFAGEPAADHELCAVCVGTDASAGRFLAVFRAADGRLAWIRRVSSAGASDSPESQPPRPWFVEDRLVVATPDGGITAFDRGGAIAWSVAATGRDRASGPLAVVASDRIVVARRAAAAGAEASGAVCLEGAAGAALWRWSRPGEQVSQLVADADGVIVVTQSADGGFRLRRLAAADGREVAADDRGAGAPPARLAGAACVGDGTLFVPVMTAVSGGREAAAGGRPDVAIDVLDPRSLARRGEPLVLATAAERTDADETDRAAARPVVLASGSGRLVWASGGMIGCLGPGHAAVAP